MINKRAFRDFGFLPLQDRVGYRQRDLLLTRLINKIRDKLRRYTLHGKKLSFISDKLFQSNEFRIGL
jgi:hypothetical protein